MSLMKRRPSPLNLTTETAQFSQMRQPGLGKVKRQAILQNGGKGTGRRRRQEKSAAPARSCAGAVGNGAGGKLAPERRAVTWADGLCPRGSCAPQRPRPGPPPSPLLPPATLEPGAPARGPGPGRPFPPGQPPSGAGVRVWKVLSRNKGLRAEARPRSRPRTCSREAWKGRVLPYPYRAPSLHPLSLLPRLPCCQLCLGTPHGRGSSSILQGGGAAGRDTG